MRWDEMQMKECEDERQIKADQGRSRDGGVYMENISKKFRIGGL